MTVQSLIDTLTMYRDKLGPDAVVAIDGFDEAYFDHIENVEGRPGVVIIDTELNVGEEPADELAPGALLELLREEPLRTLIHEAAESGAHQGYGWLLAAMAGDRPDEFGEVEAAKAILDMYLDDEMEQEGNQTIIEAAQVAAVREDTGWSVEDQCWRCVVCGEPTRDWHEKNRHAVHEECGAETY